MHSDLIPCTNRVLAHEGGYTNNPNDPGGPTNWGITIYDARKYWKPNVTIAEMRSMPVSVAIDIYEKMYWDKLQADALPGGVDYTVFDYGVNSGVSRSAKVLQRVVGVKDDGKIGNITISAVEKFKPSDIILAVNDERMKFLKSLSIWKTFGKGWTTRVSDVRRISLNLAKGIQSIAPHPHLGPMAKGWVYAPPHHLANSLVHRSFDWKAWQARQDAPVHDMYILKMNGG